MRNLLSILITVVLVISLTSCITDNVSALNIQRQYSKKNMSSIDAKQAETSSNSIHIPPKQSREELYQDIFISLLMPEIQKSIANYYKSFLTETPMVTPDYVYVLKAARLGGYRAFTFRLKLKVSAYIGPHINIGDDYMTIKMEGEGKVIIEKFEHIKSYYLELPSNYKHIIIKK